MKDKDKEILQKEYYQGNLLVQARRHYGIMEHRLFRLAAADLRPQLRGSKFFDEEFRPFHMSTSEVKALFDGAGLDASDMYGRLRATCQRMFGSYFEIGDSQKFELCHVFDKIKFSAEGGLEVLFHRDMRKLLLALEGGNYTRGILQVAFTLSSTYSLILLDLMLQYMGYKKNGKIERKLTVDELRFAMDIPKNAYEKRMNNFRRFVIDSSIAEINEKTDYYIEPDYDVIHGKFNRVEAFIFILHLPKEKEKDVDAPKLYIENLAAQIKAYGIHGNTARRLAKLPNAEQNFRLAEKEIKAGKAKNPGGLIRTAIEQDFYATNVPEKEGNDYTKDTKASRLKERMDAEILQEAQQGTKSLKDIAAGSSPASKFAQRLMKDRDRETEQKEDDGEIFNNKEEKKFFMRELVKIAKSDCSDDEKLKKTLSIDGDDESGNLLKILSLLIETSGTINKYGHREIKLQ